MDVRRRDSALVRRATAGLRRANDRHPWSHNDHFHPWILRHLPHRRRRCLDVGCGEGLLLERLADRFGEVTGVDADPAMVTSARARLAGRPHVHVSGRPWAELPPGWDLITMVATLHHLDLAPTLDAVAERLAPGGRFLVVGLAALDGPVDRLWDLGSALSNPLIGFVKHPRSATGPRPADAFPVRDPEHTVAALRAAFDAALPGARLRRREGFRFTAEWTKPG